MSGRPQGATLALRSATRRVSALCLHHHRYTVPWCIDVKLPLSSPLTNRPFRSARRHYSSQTHTATGAYVVPSAESLCSDQAANVSSPSTMRETKRSAVINLGFESLTLGNGSSQDPISQMPKKGKKGIDDTSGEIPLHASSRVYARSWHPEQQVPSYQPLLVPPLGSNQSALSPSKDSPGKAAQDLASLRLVPALAALTKQPKQHCIHRARDDAPPTPELQETSSSSRAPNSALTVERAPPPLGRWSGLAPHSQRRLHPPKLRSPGLEYIVKPPPPPVPDPSYIARSAIPAVKLPFPQPLLLVLDLNGTLLYRPKASSHHKPRPALQPFLTHCISNYKVLIWSSATPHNFTTICSKIFTPTERKLLLGEWARDTLDLSPQQYAAKIQVYKRLDRIWNTDRIQLAHPSFATGGRWSQKNTLLLDDSVLKACAQPHNAVVVPEFVGNGDREGTEVLGQVVSYLEMAVTHDDVSSFVRKQPFHVNKGWACCWG